MDQGGKSNDEDTRSRTLLALAGMDFQRIAVAGRNAQAWADLQTQAQQHPQRLHAVGFTQEVDKLMAGRPHPF